MPDPSPGTIRTLIDKDARYDLARPIVSSVLKDGTIIETVFLADQAKTQFCVARDGRWRLESTVGVHGERLVPYSARNNLIVNEVVLFPSGPEEYGSEVELVAAIQEFIHRYVDVSPMYEKVASYYVLLSWVYDAFNELPYLRLRGDPGCGKTRFLLTVGSLCYKPIFASGASTVSPMFRLLDTFRGTLIIDEGDFRFSDERAEIVKILNNGNAKGFPVLRSESTIRKEFDPRAYTVFGPKLVATRGLFEDRALESRCLTEELGQATLRTDIPISLPPEHKREALALRNKLLMFRLRNRFQRAMVENLIDATIEPRLNQIFVPLLSLVADPTTRAELRQLAQQYHRELIAERGSDSEAHALEVIRDLLAHDDPLTIKDITRLFADRFAEEYERKITGKWIGWIVRQRLHLKTHKSHGVFVVARSERPKVQRLFEKYGIEVNAANQGTLEISP